MLPTAADVLQSLWREAGLAPQALQRAQLTGQEPCLPSSFAVATAAQACAAAAALAATEVSRWRNGLVQQARIDMAAAAVECSGYFSIDGRVPDKWDKLSGLYRCSDGWVRVHANFAHHRDGVLRLLGLPAGPVTARDRVAAALEGWRAFAFEDAAAQAGLVVAAVRSFAEWDAHPQGQVVASQPLLTWEKLDDAPPRALPALTPGQRPLTGLRVLDLTRILAGPVGCRTLAAYGADVMLVNAPYLPNIESIIETSRGKRSCHIDLQTAAGCDDLRRLVQDTHVLVQAYRPGALARHGFGPEDVARLRPGVVYVSLSAYGHEGPWAQRRGFDSLVQTASGFNHAEMQASGGQAPLALPVQVLDYSAGFLMAFAAQAALLRQAQEGGSWHVRISLARTGLWLRELGRQMDGLCAVAPAVTDFLSASTTGWGALLAVRHAAQLSATPVGWDLPAMPPGSHPPAWS